MFPSGSLNQAARRSRCPGWWRSRRGRSRRSCAAGLSRSPSVRAVASSGCRRVREATAVGRPGTCLCLVARRRSRRRSSVATRPTTANARSYSRGCAAARCRAPSTTAGRRRTHPIPGRPTTKRRRHGKRKRRRPIRRKTRSRLADQVPRRRRPTSDGNPQSEGCAAWRLDPAGGSARARRQTRRGRKQPVEETGPGLVRSVRAAVRDRCPAAAQPETVDADRLHGDAAAASGSVLRADGAGRDRARRRRRVHRQQDRPAEPEDDQQTTSACSG
jgi:hypothetical protein